MSGRSARAIKVQDSLTYDNGVLGIMYATRDRAGDTAAEGLSAVKSGVSLNKDKNFLSMYSAHCHPLMPKAWVRFNAVGTLTINDSFNVSSVTDLGTGLFQVNLSADMANSSYALSAQTSEGCNGGDQFTFVDFDSRTTTTFRMSTRNTSGFNKDVDDNNVIVLGDWA